MSEGLNTHAPPVSLKFDGLALACGILYRVVYPAIDCCENVLY